MRARTWLILAFAAAGSAGLVAWRLDAARDARLEASIEASRVRRWALAEGGAGISVVPKRVPAAGRDQLRRLEDRPGFHEYAMRCSACHVLPDPTAYRAGAWNDKVGSMMGQMERAGLMPPTREELDAIVAFLRDAAENATPHNTETEP